MDLTKSIEPKSDQLNAEDLLTGPVTVTIERVTEGSAEQPVDVHLIEFPGRPYRPSKSMRRVMVRAWAKEAPVYAGRRMTLYRDPEVTCGRDKVGGIKISHLSHIGKRMSLALTVTRGKRSPHVVEPLPDVAPTITDAHMRAIKGQMQRTGLDGAAVLSIARDISRRDIGKASDLTAPEADGVIAHLADLPDAIPTEEDGDPTFPSGDAA